MDKLKKNSKMSETYVLSDSIFFTESVMVATDVPMINVALSGSLDGGITPGLTVLAGPSKHFKTSFALKMAASYLREKPESVDKLNFGQWMEGAAIKVIDRQCAFAAAR